MNPSNGYGELQKDTNPSGGEGQLDFKGGHRFFPGTKSVAGNTQGNNIVRVRAVIDGATDDDIGSMVLFRSFDVDDPSDADSTVAADQVARDIIDPNGDDGPAEAAEN